MDKNVLVDQSSTNSIATTIPSPSCFSSDIKAKTTTSSGEQQFINVPSSSVQKNNIGDSETSIPLSVASSNKETMLSTSSSTSKYKSEVDQLDDLVNDLLSEVNRPLPSMNQRYSTDRQSSISDSHPIREERIRIKPKTSLLNHDSSKEVQSNIAASIDEQLIDSLLESVQNTLRRRAQHSSINQNLHHSRRAHSSSSAYNDSLHRIDPGRARFPIKINRTDSPTSTVSSTRRAHSRDGHVSSSRAHNFRATSEPPPDGPIELRRMDLVRTPSRTYFDVPPVDYYCYSRPTVPYRGYYPRYYDCSGYESDTGSIGHRFYPNRYSRYPNRVYPQYPVRTDGYDTDSGLISSGRLRMSRPSPSVSSRMAVIPETYMVNNRMFSSSNFQPTMNQSHRRHESYSAGYDTDSTTNHHSARDFYPQQVPIQREEWTDDEFIRPRLPAEPFYQNTSIPLVPEQEDQKKNDSSLAEKKKQLLLMSASVGLSNPIKRPEKVETPQSIRSKKIISNESQTSETRTVVDIHVPIAKAPSTTISVTENPNPTVSVRKNDSRSGAARSEERTIQTTTTPDRQSLRNDGPYQAHNVSQFWYKEKMSREDAIQVLKTKASGTFLVRDSQGFPGSYGLAVKVDKLPANIQPKPGADPEAELVRHYLIERTPNGNVRLKGCPNEPDFLNLSELVYHHTLAPLALPVKLILPNASICENFQPTSNESKKVSIKTLLERGAACNVVYLNIVDVGSLSGQKAVAEALKHTFDNSENLQPTIVNFKVSTNGITLLDNKKKIFSRRHFPKENVLYCGGDYENERFWTYQFSDLEMLPKAKCFGFISKKHTDQRLSADDYECHVFAELDPGQPANAIVNFVSKVMIGSVPV